MVDWINLTEAARLDRLDPVIGRQHEIDRVIQVLLRRTRNNPLLVGKPGVGKTAIVEGLALRIVCGEVPAPLLATQILTFDLGLAIAQARARGEASTLETLFSNAIAKQPDRERSVAPHQTPSSTDTILFIDELHLLSTGAMDGVVGMINLLKLALRQGECRIVSETTPEHYQLYRAQPAHLDQYFQTIPVEEPSAEETIEILRGSVGRFETFHQVTITDGALHAAVALAAEYLPQRALPDKAIDLLDEATGRVRGRGQRAEGAVPQPVTSPAGQVSVSQADVAEIVSLWTGIPLDQIIAHPAL